MSADIKRSSGASLLGLEAAQALTRSTPADVCDELMITMIDHDHDHQSIDRLMIMKIRGGSPLTSVIGR